MANAKKLIAHTDTGKTVYAIVTRETDGYLLNDADGAFALAPADPYLSLAEHATIKGRYEVSESRTVWNDGRYMVTVYKQAGGSPAPVSDTVAGEGEMWIASDTEVVLDASVAAVKEKTDTINWSDITRLLGLTLENHVEDDIVRDGSGNKTSSSLYLYDSAANATTHDKSTGLVARYNVSAAYAGGKLSLFKVVKA